MPEAVETVGRLIAPVTPDRIATVSHKRRSRTTNDPVGARASTNTARGRRIADLYGAKLASMGGPTDPVLQAAVLRWAELTTMTEQVRAAALASPGDAALLEQLTRLERVTLCAERSLRPPAAAPAGSPAAWLAGRMDPPE
jgi:hypothetical protein